MKKQTCFFLLFINLSCGIAQNDTLLVRQMHAVLNSIRSVDAQSTEVTKQKVKWRRGFICIVSQSATEQAFRHQLRIRQVKGHVIARHRLYLGDHIQYRMVTEDDVPVLIQQSDRLKKARTTFTYLGHAKWYRTHRSDNRTNKNFVMIDVSKWR